jgi:acyl transferase domain-containing protein/surfactin synthase thioesterase subunit
MEKEVDAGALATLLKRSRDTIQQLRARLDTQASTHAEPVAVVGLGCRFPGGANNPAAFWEVLKTGRDCVRPLGSRWNLAELGSGAAQVYVRAAALLDGDVGACDAGFFGLSAAEAADLDPQQRLLLEVAWEALEHAGLAPDRLRGSRTGVFVGIAGCEYGMLPRDLAHLGPFAGTGTLTSLAAGRLAYFLGLHGPALAIDTACSSSLVALHYACESLRRGECTLALAGGVNLLLSALPMLSLCRIGALAPDGRCKTFDASGDGYGRGEGCGVLVLERLATALAQGHPIQALILGSAVNHDGRSGGLTVPNGAAQQRLIASALDYAGVAPAEVGYVEAHGTGTSLGDPIEVEALAEVLAAGRAREQPLVIGSVKTNIGHLEAAAGVAGVIKTTLCLGQRAIPPHLHMRAPNPRLPLDRIPALVPLELRPWSTSARRIAGVSAFGFSGTNAHVIMAEAPVQAPRLEGASRPRPLLLALSARSRPALDTVVGRLSAHLATHPEESLDDVCFTAAVGRAHFDHRLAVVAETREQLAAHLASVSPVAEPPGGASRSGPERLALLLDVESVDVDVPGLARAWPAFRAAFEEGTRQLGSGSGIASESFAIGYAWARAWQALGPRITSIAGTGLGALAAACVAGRVPLSAAAALLRDEPGAGALLIDTGDAELRYVSAVSGAIGQPGTRSLASLWASEVAPIERRPDLAARRLHECGHERVLALGAHGPLARACQEAGLEVLAAGETWERVLRALAKLYEAGAPIDWEALGTGQGARRISLPTYPFERSRYWIEPMSAPTPMPSCARHGDADALAGRRLLSPLRQIQIEHELSVAALPELADTPVLHAGYYLELLARGLQEALGVDTFALETLDFLVALELPPEGARRIQLLLDPDDTQVGFEFHAWNPRSGAWLRHVHGRARIGLEPQAHEAGAAARTVPVAGAIAGAEFYEDLARRGVQLGPSARWVAQVARTGPGQASAWLRAPTGSSTPGRYALGLHPGLYEACLQVFHAALPVGTSPELRFMAVRIAGLTLGVADPADDAWSCVATLETESGSPRQLRGRFELHSGAGRRLAAAALVELKGLDARHVEALRQASRAEESAADTSASAAQPELVARARRAAAEPARALLLAHVLEVLVAVLGQTGTELHQDRTLDALGLDSLAGLAFKGRLERDLGMSLPMEAFVGATPANLARLLAERLKAGNAEAALATTDAPGGHERWFAYRQARTRANWRLFCLPHGGEGAAIYRDWPAQFPDTVDVCPLRLPGDEGRRAEAPFDDMTDALEALHDALAPELERPFALYGHSYGALIAYRLAQRLHARGPRAPAHLFVGAFSAPGRGPNPILAAVSAIFARAGYEDLPDDAALGALPDDVARELLDFLITRLSGDTRFQGRDLQHDLSLQQLKAERLPALIAGLRLVASDRPEVSTTLDVPVTAFHGQRDLGVEAADMAAWAAVTTGAFELTLLPGDHFFLRRNQAQAALIAHITRCFEQQVVTGVLAMPR